MPSHFDLLYKIECKEGSHPAPAFRDAPILDVIEDWKPSKARSHLNGRVPLFDLEAYMENDTDGIDYVVIRTVECSEASVLMVRAGGPIRWTEALYTKSKASKNALQEIATCYFRPVSVQKIDTHSPYYLTKSSRDTTPPFEQNRIIPADLFLFHHRQSLKNYALEQPESREHIEDLLEYLDNRFGTEFAEANSLFVRGLVTQEYILSLFKPNELVMGGTYGRPAAFMLQEWPELNNDGWVTLKCWSFQTDGSGFARKRSVLSIPPIDTKTMKIQDLIAYPLHFATAELQDSIRSRGERQWALRNATHITYNGWNVGRDQFFVSLKHILFISTFR